MLTPQQYEARRNELIALLDEAAKLDVPEKYAAELKATAKKCKEDQFEIALVGEFQGGKSTTFNALCDGRDISPRGLGGGGIKTSAAVISAQNISDGETKDGLPEWAEVTFKTPGEIVLGMYNVIHKQLIADEDFVGSILGDKANTLSSLVSEDGFSTTVDIEKHRAAIGKAIDALWAEWEANKSAVTDDDLDQLRIVTLQMRFFNSEEYKGLLEKTILPIDKFQKLIAFPKDWNIRWLEGRNAKFSLEEIAFVFVNSVLVRLHSQNLERIGCRITDCPGLFANAYDTAVAKRTIQNADGIWYLINGEKQIGQKDMEIIRTIGAMGMIGKIDATCNLKGPHEQKISEILPATRATLKNAGFDFEVYPYNARLAFLATQGSLIANRPDAFSVLDRDCMKIDAKAKSDDETIEKMWTRMIRRLGSSTEISELEEVDGLDAEAIELVRKESRLDDILGTLEQEIVSKKSKSILIDKGSARAASALLEYEGNLKNVEDAAAADESQWKAKVDAARKALAEFIKRASATMKRSALHTEKDVLSRQMADEFLGIALNEEFLETLTYDVAAVLRTTGRGFYWTHAGMEKDLVASLTPIISQDFKDALIRAAETWRTSDNLTWKRALLSRAEGLCNDIHELWTDRKLDSDSVFQGFGPPFLSDDEIVDTCVNFSGSIFSADAMAQIAEKGRQGIFSVIARFVGQFALGFVLACIVGAPITVIGIGVWEMIQFTKSDEQRQREHAEKLAKQIEKIVPKIRPELEKILSDAELREGLRLPFVGKFAEAQDEILGKLDAAFENLKADFEKSRCEEPEKNFKKSLEERKRIAASNKEIRTSRIEPLRKKIEAFEAEVSLELD